MDLEKRNREMRQFFNEKADGYDEVHLPMMENKAAISRFLTSDTQKVLDLGAGTGLELTALFVRFPHAHVTVIDISEEMLKILRQRSFSNRLHMICGDFFEEDFGEDYDAVISSAALHHFDEAEKLRLYRKIYACLKPGGRFVNSDRCLDTRAEQEARFREFRENGANYRHYDTPLCVEAELDILAQAGFGEFTVLELDGRYKLISCAKV